MTCLKKIAAISFIICPIIFFTCNQKNAVEISDSGFLPGADGAKLYYEVIGSGADTIVVIHGGPGAGIQSVFSSVKPLAEDFVLIFYDQRGGGQSTLPADTTKLQPNYFTEDLESVRSHFNLKKMNLLTHSFGSIVAAEYAIKYPDRIKRMAFHGATGPVRADMAEYYRKTAENAPPSPDTSLSNRASKLMQSLLSGTAENAQETCREYESIAIKLDEMRGDTVTYKGTTCSGSPESVEYYYKYTAQLAPQYYGMWDYTTKLDHVNAPFLVVYGEEDTLAHQTQRDWVTSLQNGRLLLVPGVDKVAFSGNPEVVFPALKTFFDGNWPQNASVIKE